MFYLYEVENLKTGISGSGIHTYARQAKQRGMPSPGERQPGGRVCGMIGKAFRKASVISTVLLLSRVGFATV